MPIEFSGNRFVRDTITRAIKSALLNGTSGIKYKNSHVHIYVQLPATYTHHLSRSISLSLYIWL